MRTGSRDGAGGAGGERRIDAFDVYDPLSPPPDLSMIYFPHATYMPYLRHFPFPPLFSPSPLFSTVAAGLLILLGQGAISSIFPQVLVAAFFFKKKLDLY